MDLEGPPLEGKQFLADVVGPLLAASFLLLSGQGIIRKPLSAHHTFVRSWTCTNVHSWGSQWAINPPITTQQGCQGTPTAGRLSRPRAVGVTSQTGRCGVPIRPRALGLYSYSMSRCCAAMKGIDQTAYFVERQVLSEGRSQHQASRAAQLIAGALKSRTYQGYRENGQRLEVMPAVMGLDV